LLRDIEILCVKFACQKVELLKRNSHLMIFIYICYFIKRFIFLINFKKSCHLIKIISKCRFINEEREKVCWVWPDLKVKRQVNEVKMVITRLNSVWTVHKKMTRLKMEVKCWNVLTVQKEIKKGNCWHVSTVTRPNSTSDVSKGMKKLNCW